MSDLSSLHRLQHDDGSFPSSVDLPGGPYSDRNGFVTALVVRALRHVPGSAALTSLRERALAFLWCCRSTRVPGAFAFWPNATRPAWASNVPADADDTAIMLGELFRHGWLDRKVVLKSVCTALLPFRVSASEAEMSPPWVTTGSFLTWLGQADRHPSGRVTNVIDCCVNTNVVAIMAQADARHLPGYEAAVRTVVNGLNWARHDRRKLSSLTPFYPSLRSLADALEHAVECGADELRDAVERLQELGAEHFDRDDGVCCGAYGKTIWRSAALDAVLPVRPFCPASATGESWH